jgi:hypothetical protein
MANQNDLLRKERTMIDNIKTIRQNEEETLSRRGFLKGCAIVGMSALFAGASNALNLDAAEAATATRYTYTIGTSNVPVFSDKTLNKRIGAIFPSDQITVLTVTSSYCYIQYPITGGSKKGYIHTGTILTAVNGTNKTSSGSCTTYKRPGGAKYGSIYTGDACLILGTSSGWYQVKYPCGSTYKYAFIAASDYTKCFGSTLPDESVKGRMNQIMNGTLKYNNSTNLKVNTKFTGTRSSEQCKGFAKNVFYLLWGVTPGSTASSPNNYKLSGYSGMKMVGSYSSLSTSAAKSLFSSAKPGYFCQMRRRSSGGSHSAIVYSTSSTGVTFYEANTDSKNTIKLQTYSWNSLSSSNSGMSIYAPASYKLK